MATAAEIVRFWRDASYKAWFTKDEISTAAAGRSKLSTMVQRAANSRTGSWTAKAHWR